MVLCFLSLSQGLDTYCIPGPAMGWHLNVVSSCEFSCITPLAILAGPGWSSVDISGGAGTRVRQWIGLVSWVKI